MRLDGVEPVIGLGHEDAESGGTLSGAEGISIAYRRSRGKPGLPGVVFMGGYRSDMTGSKAQALARFCAVSGQPYLRFDYRGHGASTGRFEDAAIGDWLADSLSVIDRLTQGPQILVGSSMGGWLALLAALVRASRIAGLVLIAPGVDFTEALVWDRLDAAARQTLQSEGALRLPSAYDPEGYLFTRRLIEEGRAHLLLGGPIGIACPVRLLHGTEDGDVPHALSLRLLEALSGSDARLTLVKGEGHRFSTPPALALIEAAVAELSGAAS